VCCNGGNTGSIQCSVPNEKGGLLMELWVRPKYTNGYYYCSWLKTFSYAIYININDLLPQIVSWLILMSVCLVERNTLCA
jgi:hypothetical protein